MILRNFPLQTAEIVFGHDHKTATIGKIEDNLLVFKQERFGAADDLTMDEFLQETREAFKVLDEHYKKSEKLPVLVVNYENCRIGKMSTRILQLGVQEIFVSLQNNLGDRCNVYVTGVGQNFGLRSFIFVGSQILRAKGLVDQFRVCNNLEEAMSIATERSKLVSKKERETSDIQEG